MLQGNTESHKASPVQQETVQPARTLLALTPARQQAVQSSWQQAAQPLYQALRPQFEAVQQIQDPTQRHMAKAALERPFFLLWQEAVRRQVAPVFEGLERQSGGKASRLLAEAAAGQFYDLLWEEMKGRSAESVGVPGIALLENEVRSGAADGDTTALRGVVSGRLPEKGAGGDNSRLAVLPIQGELSSTISQQQYPSTFESYGNAALSLKRRKKNDTITFEKVSKVSTGGKRNETPLTRHQIEEAKRFARLQGYKGEILYSTHSNTSFHGSQEGERYHFLVIGTDALPNAKNGGTANEMVTLNGCMAHEVVGHYEAWCKKTTQENELLEEVQASIRASKFGVDLTDEERRILYQDALDRLQSAGIDLCTVENSLDIWER